MKNFPLRRLGFALLFLCLAARISRAQPGLGNAEKNEPVQMEIASPLALTQKPLALQARVGRWLPVAATLSNTGEAVRGVLTLRLSDATDTSRAPAEFFTEVDLPTNAKKRIWLYGRVESNSVDKLEVTFAGRGFKTKKAEGVVQPADASTRIVVTISDSDEKLAYLSGLRGAGLGLPEGARSTPDVPDFNGPVPSNPNLNLNAVPVRPLGAAHELVPSRWIGLDAVDLVVLQDFPHTALTPNQITALRSYVAAGGSILVLGGANWQRLATSPLADLWPVTPQSSGTASPADVSTLIARFARFPAMTGADRLGGAPVVATRGVLKSGCRALLGQGRAPLLAINDFGAGQVLFLAVDPTQPPFLGWRGLPRLWAELFHPTARPVQITAIGAQSFNNQYGYGGGYYEQASAPQTSSGALLEALATSPQLRTPPVSFIAWFLALYVFFLVPVNYVVLRLFDRRELAWLTIPVIVVAFSLVSYATALRIKGTAILTRQVNLVQGAASVSGAPSRWARADAMLWLYSPRKTSYDISSADPQMVVADYTSDANARVAIREPEENQAFALDDAPINMWDYRSFVGHSVADLKGGVRLAIKGRAVAIRNDTPQTLKGVVLVSEGRVWAYKSLRAGSSGFADAKFKDKAVANNGQLAARVENASRFDPQLYPMFSDERDKTDKKAAPSSPTGFATIPSKLLSVALADQWSTPSTFVVAWSEAPVAGLSIGAEGAKAQNLSLLIFRVENDAALRPLLAHEKRRALAEARVRLIESEAAAQKSGSQGAIYIYEAELPDAHNSQIEIALQVNRRDRYGNPYYAPNARKITQAPVRAEVFNFARGTWQPLVLRDTDPPQAAPPPAPNAPAPPNSGQRSEWKLAATLSGDAVQQCVQQPDGRMQLRFRTTFDEARVAQVHVTAQ
jgi:hypothetical protein